MSFDDSVLIFGANEKDITLLNKWLTIVDKEREQQFKRIDTSSAGGSRHFTDDVWAAAFNYMPSSLLNKLADQATWKNSNLWGVQIIHGGESGRGSIMFGPTKVPRRSGVYKFFYGDHVDDVEIKVDYV